jgi:hypothetical protein
LEIRKKHKMPHLTLYCGEGLDREENKKVKSLLHFEFAYLGDLSDPKFAKIYEELDEGIPL